MATEQATKGGLREPSENLSTATAVIFQHRVSGRDGRLRGGCPHALRLEPCLRGRLPGGCQHPAVPTLPAITALLSLRRCLLRSLNYPGRSMRPWRFLWERADTSPAMQLLASHNRAGAGGRGDSRAGCRGGGFHEASGETGGSGAVGASCKN